MILSRLGEMTGEIPFNITRLSCHTQVAKSTLICRFCLPKTLQYGRNVNVQRILGLHLWRRQGIMRATGMRLTRLNF